MSPAKSNSHAARPTEKQIERVCRMYPTNKAAARALGINSDTFGDLCREYDVKNPKQRKEMGS